MGTILIISSVIIAVLAASAYSAYIAVHPFKEKWVWASVAWGVALTAVTGIIGQYAIGLIISHVYRLPIPDVPDWVVIGWLITPWLYFAVTGPIMAVGQWVKHSMYDKLGFAREKVLVPIDGDEIRETDKLTPL